MTRPDMIVTNRMLACTIWGVVFLTMYSLQVLAADPGKHQSPYAGQENRIIKTLSNDDIQQLTEGKGWGLAKAAELNGMPGPAHLLEMKTEIALTPDQVQKIETLFNTMKQQAKKLGKKLIDLEAQLNLSFAKNSIDKVGLKQQLSAIASVYSELRFVHLAAHLETPGILTSQQIRQYNELRGYSSKDPCKNIPEGHDRTMWLKHNDCM